MQVHAPTTTIRDTGTAKGRGVFAVQAYACGALVESSPVVVFDAAFGAVPGEIRKLLFNWSALAGRSGAHGLALGYGSLYNHANPANLRYEADAVLPLLRFIAVRDIAAGEELTVNYNASGGGHESHDDAWFRRMGVTPWPGD